jgi:hypothetical protein
MATKKVGSGEWIVCDNCGARDDGWNQGGGLTVCETCGPRLEPSGANLKKCTLVCEKCREAHFTKHNAPVKPAAAA